jgi:gamma-glutamyltranspeptidase/glutathione hydrolase
MVSMDMAKPRIATAALVLFALAHPAAAQIAGTPVLGKSGMVASSSAAATQAGVEILKAGGNAVDAAVAVGFALAVTLPEAGNLGGGGFAVMRLAGGTEIALDFRETAPAGALPERYVDANGKADAKRSTVGGLAVGVPGSVAGLCLMSRRYGRLSLAQVIAPAVRLAREGFVIPQELKASLVSRPTRDLLAPFAESKRIFLEGAGALAPDAPFRQPELARTLEAIARVGSRSGDPATREAARAAHVRARDLAERLPLVPVQERLAHIAVP